MKKYFSLCLLALLASGCATHQVRFDPWKGLPPEAVGDLQRGVFAVPKDKLFDAAAATLDHEPYFHWTFSSLDKANGLIIGSAGLFREVQLRVVEEPSAGSGQDTVKSRLSVSVPRRALKTQAKIYVLKSDSSKHTAYEPAEAELGKYTVLAADAEMDPSYFYSFTYRVLNDRTQVPFSLKAHQDEEQAGLPPSQDTAPAALSPAPAQLPKAEGIPASTLPPARRE